MSADTGAREPLEAAVNGLERYGSHDENCARYQHDFKVRFRDTEPTCLCGYEVTLRDARAALAAGVGVPPDGSADLGCAPARERQDAREIQAALSQNTLAVTHLGDSDEPEVCDEQGQDLRQSPGQERELLGGDEAQRREPPVPGVRTQERDEQGGRRLLPLDSVPVVPVAHGAEGDVASEASAAEGRKPNPPAGVGEARPAACESCAEFRKQVATLKQDLGKHMAILESQRRNR